MLQVHQMYVPNKACSSVILMDMQMLSLDPETPNLFSEKLARCDPISSWMSQFQTNCNLRNVFQFDCLSVPMKVIKHVYERVEWRSTFQVLCQGLVWSWWTNGINTNVLSSCSIWVGEWSEVWQGQLCRSWESKDCCHCVNSLAHQAKES